MDDDSKIKEEKYVSFKHPQELHSSVSVKGCGEGNKLPTQAQSETPLCIRLNTHTNAMKPSLKHKHILMQTHTDTNTHYTSISIHAYYPNDMPTYIKPGHALLIIAI